MSLRLLIFKAKKAGRARPEAANSGTGLDRLAGAAAFRFNLSQIP